MAEGKRLWRKKSYGEKELKERWKKLSITIDKKIQNKMQDKIKIQDKIKRKRAKKMFLEELPLSPSLESYIEEISKTLTKQIDKEIFSKKYAPAATILKLVGAGVFFTASIAIPTLPMAIKPFLNKENEFEVWKRFNIPYLKRTLQRLEKQKLVEIHDKDKYQIVEITDRGRRRILKFALEELSVEKPKFWDGKWRLVSYDIPGKLKQWRNIFREYLHAWGFYPLHESMYLHAYPCEKQVEFLREYLGIGEYIRIFQVSRIEQNKPFRDFFGI